MTNLEQFISQYVTERDSSLFATDIQNNFDALTNAIGGKTMLVIGGAGSIGSSFIKACLQFKPKSLVVVDVNGSEGPHFSSVSTGTTASGANLAPLDPTRTAKAYVRAERDIVMFRVNGTNVYPEPNDGATMRYIKGRK